jgi:hypothetical protein
MLSTAKLALAVQVQPTKQQLVDYANAAAAINLYAYAITNQNMPVLNNPPSDYGQFTASFSPAKAHCLNWTNSIFPMMLSFPQTIVNAQNLFSLENTEAGLALGILQTDPTNAQAKTSLNNAIAGMLALINAQIATGNSLLGDLNTFSTNITADAKTLDTIATQALAYVKSDKDQIDKLNDLIQQLNADISTMQTWLTVSEIGIGLSIFVGLIGAVVCFIPGAQGVGAGIIVVAVAGLGASIAGTIIATKKIAADQDAIASEQKQIDGINQDISMLTTLNTQFKYLQTANQNAQAAMVTVIKMWQDLADILTQVQTELNDASQDAASATYAKVATDLQAADSNWNEVVAFAQALLGVNYNWIDANGVTHTFSATPPPVNGGQVTNIK